MVVQTGLYGLATVPYLEWCRRRYGDTFTVRLPGAVRMVVFADPADIKAVFALGADDFSAESSAEPLAPFVGERSVLLMDGEHHKNERARLVKSLRGESMTAWATAMEQATRAELATWPTGEPFAVLPRLRSIALDVILRTVFGTPGLPRPRRLPPRALPRPALDPTTWLPFGGGIRRCLGAAFATLEMKTVLRVLLTDACLRPAQMRLERPKRRAVTLVPAHGTRVVLEANP